MTPEEFGRHADVSRETLARFRTYETLIKKWNPRINLVSKASLDELWARHFLDSVQVFEAGSRVGRWADLGTGGGFPGIVVAIMAAEKCPGMDVICVESDARKAVFLKTVLRETGVKGTVLSERIEEVAPLKADIVSARALASLSDLLGYADRHLADGGKAILPKGADHEKELKEALETWSFQADKLPSKTNPEAVVLRIGEIERA